MKNMTNSKQASKQASKHFLSIIVSCLTAAVLGVAVVISCICGLLTWPSAAADEIFIISSATKIGEIELGEYPQTYVGDALNNELKNAVANGIATTTGKSYTVNNNYVAKIYDEYQYHGIKYAYVVKAYPHSSGATQYFLNGQTIVSETPYFFTVEPIIWEVLVVNDSQIVLVTKNILTCSYLDQVADRCWEECFARKFLNEDLITSFGIQDYVKEIKHYTSSMEDACDGAIVTDKLWLPSVQEIELFSPNTLVKSGMDFTRATYLNNANGNAFYYLRSLGSVENRVCGVSNIGRASGSSFAATNHHFGMLPAFVLNDATAQRVDKVVPPTCEKEGYTEHYWTINGKQYDYTKDNVTKLADHTWGAWETVTENTCVEDGEQRHTCTVCGYTETEHVPANDAKHHYVTQDPVAPTCGHDGYTEHKCSVCGATYRDNITAALEHVWSDWHTTKEPTATSTGTAERECELCHTTEQKTLPALGVPSGTTTPTPTDNNGGQGWLIFGIVAGGILVLGSVTISWLFLGLSRRKKQTAAA